MARLSEKSRSHVETVSDWPKGTYKRKIGFLHDQVWFPVSGNEYMQERPSPEYMVKHTIAGNTYYRLYLADGCSGSSGSTSGFTRSIRVTTTAQCMTIRGGSSRYRSPRTMKRWRNRYRARFRGTTGVSADLEITRRTGGDGYARSARSCRTFGERRTDTSY